MKIYFACSITGGRASAHVYPEIVRLMKEQGLQVLSEAFADPEVKAATGLGMKHGMTPAEIWKWDLDWVAEADCIIAEVTQPSLGVGYEIAKAHEWNKPVLALCRPESGKKLSSMISGSPNVTVFEYADVAETGPAIKDFVASLAARV